MFTETQRIRRPGFWIMAGLWLAINIWLLSNSSSPGQWVFFGSFCVSIVSLLFYLRLNTELKRHKIQLDFLYTHRDIRYKDIVSAEHVTYRPWDYSRWNRRKFEVKAYIAVGNEGVQLTLKSGETVLIGSQRPAELLASIKQRLE